MSKKFSKIGLLGKNSNNEKIWQIAQLGCPVQSIQLTSSVLGTTSLAFLKNENNYLSSLYRIQTSNSQSLYTQDGYTISLIPKIEDLCQEPYIETEDVSNKVTFSWNNNTFVDFNASGCFARRYIFSKKESPSFSYFSCKGLVTSDVSALVTTSTMGCRTDSTNQTINGVNTKEIAQAFGLNTDRLKHEYLINGVVTNNLDVVQNNITLLLAKPNNTAQTLRLYLFRPISTISTGSYIQFCFCYFGNSSNLN